MPQQPLPAKLKHMSSLAKLMDSQFSVPGTKMRFGLDGVLGLIPGLGDLSTFAVSGYLVFLMASNGASGFVLARMILNVLLDVTIGAIPFVGDLFDFAFKANSRNMKLMQEHYQEGRHNGSAWKVIIPVLIVLLIVVLVIMWLAYKLAAYVWNAIF
jgi:NAD/NADP transhydrogenase beta subunit